MLEGDVTKFKGDWKNRLIIKNYGALKIGW